MTSPSGCAAAIACPTATDSAVPATTVITVLLLLLLLLLHRPRQRQQRDVGQD
jgi:MYXO-CTERM domain-containing protein